MNQRPLWISLLTVWLAACGSDGSGDAPAELTGVLKAGGVLGVHFATPSRSGTTDAAGTFRYLPGETVSFSIGGIELGSVPGAGEITPFTLAGLTPPTTEPALRRELDRTRRIATPLGKAINLQMLLFALDGVHDPANGIDVSAKASTLDGVQLDVGLPIGLFRSSLQKTVPGLTANVPHSYALAYLYRALNILVPVHADTRAELSYAGVTVPLVTSNLYGADGSHSSQSQDSDGDGNAESSIEWTYDPLGRIRSVLSLYPPSGFTGAAQSFVYEYDNRGVRTHTIQDATYQSPGSPPLALHNVARYTVDDFDFITLEVVESDADLDGNPDAGLTNVITYDARHNVTAQRIAPDNELDGTPDEFVSYAVEYDGVDRMTRLVLEFDYQADGIVDQRYESAYEFEGAPGRVIERGSSDYDADGEIDARFVITSEYDKTGYIRTRFEERDDDANGTVDSTSSNTYTHDDAQRPLTQESRYDVDGNGTFESSQRVSHSYDGLGNLLTSEILHDSPSGDEIDATITNTWQYGASGELLGASYRGVTSGAIDLAQDTTTTVTNVVIPDGVLLLAQRYLEGFNGVVPNYPGAPGYAVNAAYTDGFGKIRRQPVAGKLLVSF